ncbi:MAG TPA: magnesium transporter [Pseudomonadales bacterium]|nr:magnesium transporter [Pseudomonadales bacterium]
MMLSDEVLSAAPDVAVSVLTRQSEEELLAWIEEGSVTRAVIALRHLDADTAGRLIEAFPPRRRADVIAAMEPRDAFRCLRTIPRRRREALVETLPPAVKREAERILRVREDSAAALMEIQALHVTTQTQVHECLARVQHCQTRLARTLFVVDADDNLVGAVDLQSLIASAPDVRVGTIMRAIKWQVDEFTTREEIAAGIGRYNVNTLPVVNLQGRFSGIIRSENLFDAVEQDALSDLQTMVGAGKDEHALSTVWTTIRKRHSWLQINLVTAFLAASVVGLFEGTIAKFTALAVLMPVVAGQSGNSGSQALAVTLRGLALREIGVNAWLRVVRKEMAAGMLNGIGIALVTSLSVYVWSKSWGLALVIGLAMVASMTIAGVAGAFIPIMMARFGQDPATSSTIVLTTVTDVSGFFSFLGIATLLSFLL